MPSMHGDLVAGRSPSAAQWSGKLLSVFGPCVDMTGREDIGFLSFACVRDSDHNQSSRNSNFTWPLEVYTLVVRR